MIAMNKWRKSTCYSIICCLIVLNSCHGHKEKSNLTIRYLTDTIKVDSLFEAELYVNNHYTLIPLFCIVQNKDTFGLPFDSIKGCAIFKARVASSGEKHYKGFVHFYNQRGKLIHEEFDINYIVK